VPAVRLDTRAAFWWLLAGIALIFGVALFNHGPIPSMEPRFAEVIREMARTGEYLVPIKNHVPYIEYPPFYYWLALFPHLAGLPILAAIRLPAYLAFLLWIGWLWRLQRELELEWSPALLAFAGAGLPGVIYVFFIAQTDPLVTLGTLIAFTGFTRFRLGKRPFWWELWLGVTLATLAKGPVGMAVTLPAMLLEIGIAHLTVQRGAPLGQRLRGAIREAWRMGWLRGIGLVLLANVPWYIAAGMKIDWDAVRAMLVYQNFTRFLVGFDHLRPWWYYGKTIWYDMFPAVLLFPLGIWAGARRLRELRLRLPLVWALYTLLFFSLSQSKQGKYVLVAAPAFVLAGLMALETLRGEALRERIGRWLRWWTAGLLTLFGVVVIFFLPHFNGRIVSAQGFARIRQARTEHPGRIISFHWPRSLMLWELGSPMPYVRSSRELYHEIHSGRIRPGDYILVKDKNLPAPGRPPSTTLMPAPGPPYLQQVLKTKAEKRVTLYRVLPGAARAPVPKTPPPPAWHWYDQFDTD